MDQRPSFAPVPSRPPHQQGTPFLGQGAPWVQPPGLSTLGPRRGAGGGLGGGPRPSCLPINDSDREGHGWGPQHGRDADSDPPAAGTDALSGSETSAQRLLLRFPRREPTRGGAGTAGAFGPPRRECRDPVTRHSETPRSPFPSPAGVGPRPTEAPGEASARPLPVPPPGRNGTAPRGGVRDRRIRKENGIAKEGGGFPVWAWRGCSRAPFLPGRGWEGRAGKHWGCAGARPGGPGLLTALQGRWTGRRLTREARGSGKCWKRAPS